MPGSRSAVNRLHRELLAVGPLGEVLCAAERALGSEAAQALAAHDELRSMIRRQLAPARVHVVEQQASRRLGAVAVHQERQQARQVGVLHAHGGPVAVPEVLERLGLVLVHPAAPRRRHDVEDPSVEGAEPLELGDGLCGLLSQVRRPVGADAHVGPDRRPRRPWAAERGDLRARRCVGDEHPTRPAQVRPGHAGLWAARQEAARGCGTSVENSSLAVMYVASRLSSRRLVATPVTST